MSAAPGRASRGAAPAARPKSPARSRALAARPGAPSGPPAPGRGAGCLGAQPRRLPGRRGRAAGNHRDRRLVGLWRARGQGLRPRTAQPCASWGDAALRLPAIHLVFGLAKRWLLGTHHGAVSAQAPAGLSRRVRLPLQPPHRQEPQSPLRPRHPASGPDPSRHLSCHRRNGRFLKVVESLVATIPTWSPATASK